MNQSASLRKTEWVLFLLVLLCSGWFFSLGTWAQSSRMDMILAATEHGTFRIDTFLTDVSDNQNTGDWSLSPDGHYYSNKAPGQALLAIPVYSVLRTVCRSAGVPGSLEADILCAWSVNIVVSAIPTAFAAVLLFRILLLLGLSRVRSLFFASAGILATSMALYSSAMWAHPLSASFLTAALYVFLKDPDRRGNLAAGFFAGFAVLSDYIALPSALFFLIYAFRKTGKKGLFFAAGALFPAAVYCWYHWICFGNPFLPATFWNNPIFRQQEILGIPSSVKFLKLLFGSHRGLFFAFPFLLAVIPGIRVLWRDGKEKREFLILLLSWILSGLLINSSFNGWHGGAALSSRYIICSIPAWVILAAHIPLNGILSRWFILLSSGFSLFNVTAAQFTTPIVPEAFLNPWTAFVYPVSLQIFTTKVKGIWLGYRHFIPDPARPVTNFILTPGSLSGISDNRIEALILAVLFAAALFLFQRIGTDLLSHLISLFRDTRDFLNRKREITFSFNGFVIAAGLFLLFLFPGNIPFVMDEPSLQILACESNTNNIWAAHGLEGSLGHTYSPFPTWFYQCMQLLTRDLILIEIMKAVLLGVGGVWLLFRIGKELEFPKGLLPAIALASAWYWHFSRALWDNVFLLPLSALILLFLILYLKTEKRRWLLLSGLSALLAVWIHTMAVPLACAMVLLFLTVRVDLFRKHAGFFCILGGVCAAGVFLILFPKLMISLTGEKSGVLGIVPLPEIFKMSLGCFDSILRPDFRTDFIQGYSLCGIVPLPVLCFLENLSGGAALLLFLAGTGFLVVNRKRRSPADQAAWFAVFAILSHIVMACCLRVPYYRHYNTMPMLIPGFVLLAYGSVELAKRVFRLEKALRILMLGTSLAVIVICTITIDLNGGDRTKYYGPTLSNQMVLAEKIHRFSKGTNIPIEILDRQEISNYLPYSLHGCYFLLTREYPPDNTEDSGRKILCFLLYPGAEGSGFADVRLQYYRDPASRQRPGPFLQH